MNCLGRVWSSQSECRESAGMDYGAANGLPFEGITWYLLLVSINLHALLSNLSWHLPARYKRDRDDNFLHPP